MNSLNGMSNREFFMPTKAEIPQAVRPGAIFPIVIPISVFILIFVLISSSICQADEINDNRLADAIYCAEGGAKTRYPYGIKSINTYGNKEYARKICLNSIRNAKKRWIKADRPKDFISFMGDRYCPVSDCPKLNRNWIKNVKIFYKQAGH